MDFLILPHQLFHKQYLDNKYKYHIYEHPQYFTKYKFNKKKIILHRASMNYQYPHSFPLCNQNLYSCPLF